VGKKEKNFRVLKNPSVPHTHNHIAGTQAEAHTHAHGHSAFVRNVQIVSEIRSKVNKLSSKPSEKTSEIIRSARCANENAKSEPKILNKTCAILQCFLAVYIVVFV